MALRVHPFRPPRARALLALGGRSHPGVLAPLEYGTAGGHAYVVCECAPGAPLSERRRPWSEADIIRLVLRPAAATLALLAGRQVTHRAVRLDNIFRGEGGRAVLGPAWSAPPASLQPAVYEPSYVAGCLPEGRGEGSGRRRRLCAGRGAGGAGPGPPAARGAGRGGRHPPQARAGQPRRPGRRGAAAARDRRARLRHAGRGPGAPAEPGPAAGPGRRAQPPRRRQAAAPGRGTARGRRPGGVEHTLPGPCDGGTARGGRWPCCAPARWSAGCGATCRTPACCRAWTRRCAAGPGAAPAMPTRCC